MNSFTFSRVFLRNASPSTPRPNRPAYSMGDGPRMARLSQRADVDRQIAADGDVAGQRRTGAVVAEIERRHVEGALRVLRQRGVVAEERRAELGRVAFERSDRERALHRRTGLRRQRGRVAM